MLTPSESTIILRLLSAGDPLSPVLVLVLALVLESGRSLGDLGDCCSSVSNCLCLCLWIDA
jgi:hypothetical protein